MVPSAAMARMEVPTAQLWLTRDWMMFVSTPMEIAPVAPPPVSPPSTATLVMSPGPTSSASQVTKPLGGVRRQESEGPLWVAAVLGEAKVNATDDVPALVGARQQRLNGPGFPCGPARAGSRCCTRPPAWEVPHRAPARSDIAPESRCGEEHAAPRWADRVAKAHRAVSHAVRHSVSS